MSDNLTANTTSFHAVLRLTWMAAVGAVGRLKTALLGGKVAAAAAVAAGWVAAVPVGADTAADGACCACSASSSSSSSASSCSNSSWPHQRHGGCG